MNQYPHMHTTDCTQMWPLALRPCNCPKPRHRSTRPVDAPSQADRVPGTHAAWVTPLTAKIHKGKTR